MQDSLPRKLHWGRKYFASAGSPGGGFGQKMVAEFTIGKKNMEVEEEIRQLSPMHEICEHLR